MVEWLLFKSILLIQLEIMKKKTTLLDRLKPELKEALINHTEYETIRESIIKSLKDKRFVTDLTISESYYLGICIGKSLPSILDIYNCFIDVVDTTLIDVDHDGIPTNVTDEDVEKYNHQAMIDHEWYETVG